MKIASNSSRQASPVTCKCGILMSDLRGFTPISEQYPTLSILPLLDHYFQQMTLIIDRHGGSIDKFMGDSVLAVFNAQQDPNACMRMLSCAIDMQLAMDAINEFGRSLGLPDIFMGIGLNAGDVVACELGSDIYRERTVLGEPVNMVSRITAHTLRGQILLSEEVFNHCKDQTETGSGFKLLLKGKKKVVKVYELQALLEPEFKRVPVRENRKSPRVDACLPISYNLVRDKGVLPAAIIAETSDLSYGGMRIITPQEHRLLDEIRILVPFAIGDEASSAVYAKVLSCRPAEDRNFSISVEFTYLDEFARKSIKALVDQLV